VDRAASTFLATGRQTQRLLHHPLLHVVPPPAALQHGCFV
jgi:hypothetical protein